MNNYQSDKKNKNVIGYLKAKGCKLKLEVYHETTSLEYLSIKFLSLVEIRLLFFIFSLESQNSKLQHFIIEKTEITDL